ncbi:MAG: SAM-dependent methyltransferase [Gammaproteobacteria bacterium]|nr:MAG: SAM-dependent methyltransferase [Gammaproteobacteria bacterium]RLA02541.1 MAG: SAM-dependent methyltransferase [Gammaproteobacteria bacterium]HHA19660.1 class I SAM-dependent methyltransferase [Methylophaga sp.]
MIHTTVFESEHEQYDAWFLRHKLAYQSELLAVRALLPYQGVGLSIGVGTGRFAAPLGIQFGLDPVAEMLAYAKKREVTPILGTGEALPFIDDSFDYALSVTTICFVNDARAMLCEAKRILKPQGTLTIGFIDRDTRLGQHYLKHQADSLFYQEAKFFSSEDIKTLLQETGFDDLSWVQTLFCLPEESNVIEPIMPGYGQGAFVAVKGQC